MKARLAAVLSISGVLVAGSAAALVNTQVLSATPTSKNSGTVVLADATSTSQSGTTLPGSTLPGVTIAPSTTAGSAGSQAVYQVDVAGLVTLDTAGAQLSIVSAVPNAGWTVTKAESEDPLNVEVTFQSASVEVEFHANLLFGVVSTSVESKSLVANTAASTVSTPGGGSSPTTANSIDDNDGSDDNSGHGGGSEDESDDDESGHGGGGSDDSNDD